MRPLVLVAHGPTSDADAARWVANIASATRPLAALVTDRAIHVGLLRDDAPADVRARAVEDIRDTIHSLFD
jgi:sirohydrochlorin cobaltochelatase